MLLGACSLLYLKDGPVLHLTQWQHWNSLHESSDVQSKKKGRRITGKGRGKEGMTDRIFNIIDTFIKAGCP